MKNSDLQSHVKGESIFVDDIVLPEGTLHAAVYASTIAHGKIIELDISESEKQEGVYKVFTYKDIPGLNQIGNIIQDEKLFAEDEVEYIGEPIALIVASDTKIARAAANKIKIKYHELPIITDPREAAKKGKLIVPPVIFSFGNTSDAFSKCKYVFEDRVDIGGQEHLYLETQSCLAIPSEAGCLKVYSSTQSPTAVQKVIARVLGLSMNQVEVDVLRLGGGFGGKEDQATSWATLAALAAFKTKKPVKLVLNRHEDLFMTGKRHPYSADFKIGLDENFKILSYEVRFYQNAGAFADLSTAILERTLFHTTNSYFIPNVKAIGYSCKTNLPPNTAFRGFGGPQGMFVIESAIHKAASEIGIPAFVIQESNLIKEENYFYYGQEAKNVNASKSWMQAKEKYKLNEKVLEIKNFNSQKSIYKKGIAVMPICFGISFTTSLLNQASALVHIYTDGSVSISTAAVEMGQGVNEKIKIIASKTLGININRIKIESTNTTRVANTSPTAASSAADLNGNAVKIACNNLIERITQHIKNDNQLDLKSKVKIIDEEVIVDDKLFGLKWNELILNCYINRISLSAQAYYATPDIYFDRRINQGHPFAYHVYGTAIIIVKLDTLRGIYEIESVEIIHDLGKSLNEKIDIGQIEGGLMQGLGWVTIEELIQNDSGKLISNSLSTYKIPDIQFVPKNIKIDFLENSLNDYGPFNSKAVGEPPLMYGIGAYFAIANAILAFDPNIKIKYSSPFTPEKVLLSLKNHKTIKKETA